MSNTELKRKRDSDECGLLPNKVARNTTEDELLSSESSFQSLNDDVLNIIFNYLKLSVKSLVALSITCSRWHNQIKSILEKDLQHFFPLSYKEYRGEKLYTIEDFYYLRSQSLDLQRFEFPQIMHCNGLYAVPWAPHIIFFNSWHLSYSIIDLNKKEITTSDFDAIPPVMDCAFSRLCSINEERKQVVITNTDYNEEEMEIYDWINVYNVSCSGSVELVTRFKSSYSFVWSDVRGEEVTHPPATLFLDRNGIIWHSDGERLRRFSIELNKEIETIDDIEGYRIKGIGEWDGKVLIFCWLFDLSVFDTSTEEDILNRLPQWDKIIDLEYFGSTSIFTIENDLAIVQGRESSNDRFIIAIFNLRTLQYVYLNTENEQINLLSPDGKELGTCRAKSFAISESKLMNRHLKHTRLPEMDPISISGKTFSVVGNQLIYSSNDGEDLSIDRLTPNKMKTDLKRKRDLDKNDTKSNKVV